MRCSAGGRRWSTAAAAVVLLLAGCGDDDDGAEDEVPEVESSTTTTEPTTTTTVAACPPVEPSTAAEATAQEADVDGDGQDDLVQSFPEGDHVRLLVELAAGGGATAELPAADAAAVDLLGAEPLDAEDGREVLWVRVGSGAATTILGLFHVDGCNLEPATFEDGTPVQLPIGGTVGTTAGAGCGVGTDPEADLLVYEASYVSETEYEITTTEYRWEGGVLVESPETDPTVTTSDDVSDAAEFHCGDVSL